VAVVVYLPDYKLDGRKDRKMVNFCPLLYRHLEEDYVEVERFGPAVLKVLRKS
jgi:hypothetical protein